MLDYLYGLFLWRIRPVAVAAAFVWGYCYGAHGMQWFERANLAVCFIVSGLLVMTPLITERDWDTNELSDRYKKWCGIE